MLNFMLFGKIGAGVVLIFRILAGAPMLLQHATQYTIPVYMYLVLQIYMQSMYGRNEARSAHCLFKILDKSYFVINLLPFILPRLT